MVFIAELLGFIATIFSVVAIMPQVIQTWRTKLTRDVNLHTLLIFTTGQLLWFIYGFLINSLPLMAANSIIFTLALVVLLHKLKYG